ncbi:mediator of RNA polymerase II transcription subunit 25 [Vigna angularis]|uniref:mediator of RNA polymerase II transcription subunit 25 n=1 Tax=Phaseolus angularis TaxID=3914 RepID=UPI00080A472D|nr:mediator of RNA polymerase II transcription subunit 25 [Vigna angularis]
MAPKKWLNILVDGSSALGPYWPNIVSEYLEKIVRTFFYNSIEEEANEAPCELGLVMYNSNSNTGLDVQYIHWTRDVNYFLDILSCLAFNGDNLNQHAMVEGLAKALMMFPRPSNVMTAQEYYNGERHCVVVAARDPFPTRMLVSVPEITKEGIIGTNLHYVNADFYEVAEMFGPLAVSLSIISPIQHPIFEVIFNVANDGSIVSTSPICSTRMDQFTVLLSRKFKEAHDAFRGKRIMDPSTEEWIESMKRTNNTRFPINFANHCQAMVSTTPTLTAGEGSSKGVVMEERDNMGVLGGMSMLPGSTGNSLNVQPYATNNGGGGGGGHQHFQFGRSAVGSSTRAPPASATPQFNHTNTLPFSPSFTNFQPYVHAWEGCLVGNIHNNRSSILIAKALKRETSPLTLTENWSSRLEIILYLSEKAVSHTINIYSEPVDYVFFSIMQFNNLDLYEHLKNKKLCAKIRLPSQTLILSATESKDHYIGTIFLGETIFVEPI